MPLLHFFFALNTPASLYLFASFRPPFGLKFLFTFPLKSLLSTHSSVKSLLFPSLLYWNLYFTFPSLSLFYWSLYFIEASTFSTFSTLFYWSLHFLCIFLLKSLLYRNLYFLTTFLLKSPLSLYFSIETSTFFSLDFPIETCAFSIETSAFCLLFCYFLFTFLLKSLVSLHFCFETLFSCHLFLKSLLSLHFSIEIFLFTFLVKSFLWLRFSIEISTLSALFHWNFYPNSPWRHHYKAICISLSAIPTSTAPQPATQSHLDAAVTRRLAICNCIPQKHSATTSKWAQPSAHRYKASSNLQLQSQ